MEIAPSMTKENQQWLGIHVAKLKTTYVRTMWKIKPVGNLFLLYPFLRISIIKLICTEWWNTRFDPTSPQSNQIEPEEEDHVLSWSSWRAYSPHLVHLSIQYTYPTSYDTPPFSWTSEVGSKETDEKADEVLKLDILDYWTPENHYRWSKSRNV